MSELETMQKVPLTRDEDGVWRIIGSRVSLDSIVGQFKAGATAEQIQEDFPSVALSDIYSLIAYYLCNSRAVGDYLGEQARATQGVRQQVESDLDTKELRDRLRQRRAPITA
jgi:uncharacterized protein (DUF433 family)